MNHDDFYVVLPSNSCADIHPSNNASKYYVTFNETIRLDPKEGWKVALTEFDFNSLLLTIESDHYITYTKATIVQYDAVVNIRFDSKGNAFLRYQADFPPPTVHPPYDVWDEIKHFVQKVDGGITFAFGGSRHRFKLNFYDIRQAEFLGFSKYEYESEYEDAYGGYAVIGENPVQKENLVNDNLDFQFQR